MSEPRSIWGNIRHPVVSLRELCGGEAAYPLLLLFGLNAVDELDRARGGIANDKTANVAGPRTASDAEIAQFTATAM